MTHYVVIHALMVSWYPKRRFGKPIGDVMMYLDPWRSCCVVEVVEEAHGAFCLMKKSCRSPWTHILWLNGPCPLKGDDVVIDDLMKTWNP